MPVTDGGAYLNCLSENCTGIMTQTHILEMRILRHHQGVLAFLLKCGKMSFHVCIVTASCSSSLDSFTVADLPIYLIA